MPSSKSIHLSRRLVWMAYFSGAFGLAMSAQVNFLVPLRARELGASFDVIGIIVGAGALAPALLSVSLGAIIDRLGPRRSFVLGTGIASALSLALVLVTSYWWFLAVQPFLGLARNFGWVASQGYVTSLARTSQERSALSGRFSFFGNVGQMLGPIMIGGVAQLVGFRWAFLFMALYAGVFALVGMMLKETQTADERASRKKQGTGFRAAGGLFRIRAIRVALCLTFARLWTTWVFTSFFPVFLVDTGVEPGIVGLVTATKGLVATAFAPTTGFWTRFAQPQTVTALGLGCGALGIFLAPHLATVPLVFVVPALVGVGTGLSLPLLMSIVTTAVPSEQRGLALGLRSSVNQTAATTAPIIVGPLITALGMVLGFTFGGVIAAGMLIGSRVIHAVDQREQRRLAAKEASGITDPPSEGRQP